MIAVGYELSRPSAEPCSDHRGGPVQSAAQAPADTPAEPSCPPMGAGSATALTATAATSFWHRSLTPEQILRDQPKPPT